MPLYTPTTPRVIASERTPPMFRPSNQANLVPAVPLNPAPSQSFLPGLGQVRPANSAATGLDPQTEAELDLMRLKQQRGEKAQKAAIRTQARQLEQGIARWRTKLEQAKVTGMPMSRGATRELESKIQRAEKSLRWLSHLERSAFPQGGGTVAPPWQRSPVYVQQGRSFRPLRAQRLNRAMSPATPDPLAFEPAGESFQADRAKILDMQANIQPVSGLGQLGLTTPIILAGAAGLGLYLLMRKRR